MLPCSVAASSSSCDDARYALLDTTISITQLYINITRSGGLCALKSPRPNVSPRPTRSKVRVTVYKRRRARSLDRPGIAKASLHVTRVVDLRARP